MSVRVIVGIAVQDDLTSQFAVMERVCHRIHAAVALGSKRGCEIVAAHLDHHLDPRSSQRAREAERLATMIGAPIELGEADPQSMSEVDRGLEDWARRVRYDFLERCRRSSGSRYIATAQDRDDQIETILIRLLGGSGLEALWT